MAVFRGGGARHGREMDKQVVYDWSLRHIRWGDVFKYQHWGGFLLFIPAVVITGEPVCIAVCTTQQWFTLQQMMQITDTVLM